MFGVLMLLHAIEDFAFASGFFQSGPGEGGFLFGMQAAIEPFATALLESLDVLIQLQDLRAFFAGGVLEQSGSIEFLLSFREFGTSATHLHESAGMLLRGVLFDFSL